MKMKKIIVHDYTPSVTNSITNAIDQFGINLETNSYSSSSSSSDSDLLPISEFDANNINLSDKIDLNANSNDIKMDEKDTLITPYSPIASNLSTISESTDDVEMDKEQSDDLLHGSSIHIWSDPTTEKILYSSDFISSDEDSSSLVTDNEIINHHDSLSSDDVQSDSSSDDNSIDSSDSFTKSPADSITESLSDSDSSDSSDSDSSDSDSSESDLSDSDSSESDLSGYQYKKPASVISCTKSYDNYNDHDIINKYSTISQEGFNNFLEKINKIISDKASHQIDPINKMIKTVQDNTSSSVDDEFSNNDSDIFIYNKPNIAVNFIEEEDKSNDIYNHCVGTYYKCYENTSGINTNRINEILDFDKEHNNQSTLINTEQLLNQLEEKMVMLKTKLHKIESTRLFEDDEMPPLEDDDEMPPLVEDNNEMPPPLEDDDEMPPLEDDNEMPPLVDDNDKIPPLVDDKLKKSNQGYCKCHNKSHKKHTNSKQKARSGISYIHPYIERMKYNKPYALSYNTYPSASYMYPLNTYYEQPKHYSYTTHTSNGYTETYSTTTRYVNGSYSTNTYISYKW